MNQDKPAYHVTPEGSIVTFFFAPEVESALIGLVWREPERLGILKRELDPAIHFHQGHLRHILEALDLAYRELSTVDFACVIQTLRELRRLEDCGGLESVNDVWEAGEFLDSPIWQASGATDVLFGEYLRLLKTYAINRKLDPPRPVYRFSGGQFQIWNNKLKTNERDPDVIGSGRIAGRPYELKGWTNLTDSGEEFLQCQLFPKA